MSRLTVAFYDSGAVCFEDSVVTDSGVAAPSRSAILPAFFALARRSIEWLGTSARKLRATEAPCLFGNLQCSEAIGTVADLAKRIETRHPLRLESPFEGCDTIAGGLWSGRGVLGLNTDDALAHLQFDAGTVELPIHLHEHSDRFIVVEDGEGIYHYAPGTIDSFDGTGVISVPVRPGDVILFLRNVLHTFSAAARPLRLLSYHAPQIDFDDPRQYTLPKFLWYPSGHIASSCVPPIASVESSGRYPHNAVIPIA